MTLKFTAALALLGLLATTAAAQMPEDRSTAQVVGHVNRLEQKKATPELQKNLKLPQGFKLEAWATGLEAPRMMAVGPQGQVYVSSRKKGEVWLMGDKNNDGKADPPQTVFSREHAHGLAVHNNQLYIITVTEVFRAPIKADGTLGEAEKIIENLPDGGQHPNRTIFFGPDNMLYVSVGSTCNACDEPNKENATLLQFTPEGGGRKIYAKGLRNTIGMDWHPQTGQLWGLDHGIDWLGDNEQQEELNLISEDSHYGWPYIYADGKQNPADIPEEGFEAFKKKVTNPAMLFTAHSAPMNFVFYQGNQFPAAYRNSAIASMHGSWNRKEPSGYKLVRIEFKDGRPVKQEDFLTGFVVENGTAQFGRPCGLLQLPDGSLLMSDDGAGNIYRISYTGK
jgi:glucose/arabinose dehydrogenase